MQRAAAIARHHAPGVSRAKKQDIMLRKRDSKSEENQHPYNYINPGQLE